MTGFAARLGTDVEPTCSTPRALSLSTALTRVASSSKSAGQTGSYAAMAIATGSGGPPTQMLSSRGVS